MSAPAIAFFDAKPYDIKFFDQANQDYHYNLNYINSRLNDVTTKLAAEHEIVCAFVNDVLDKAVITELARLGVKLIALRCAGYNNVDFKEAYEKIRVVRVPDYSPYAVAEHAVALLLALNRKTHRAYHRIRDNNFSINGLMGFDLRGKTAGVIGVGKIGRVLVRILKGFSMEVIGYDKFRDEDVAHDLGFSYVELDELLRAADVVFLNCPLTQETYHIINTDSIAQMKDGVFLINTGRGKLIDTRALIHGLKHEKIGAAGLDVYEEESGVFFEDFSNEVITDDVLARLLTFSNVLITSHQGFFTREAMQTIAETTLGNIASFFKGAALPNEICYQCATGAAGHCRREAAGRCF